MSTVREIHREAIDWLKQANEAKEAGDYDAYRNLMSKAFEFEKKAALMLSSNYDAEPTRSVLFRSAGYMANAIGQYEEACRLLYLALAGTPYSEIEKEIKILLSESIYQKAVKNKSLQEVDNAYILMLRERALHVRLKPKTLHYGSAIAIDCIIDYLRNIQKSFANYFEVNFRKNFPPNGDINYEKKLNILRSETKTLCVGLEYKSFGVSIAADTRVVNFQLLYGDKYTDFKEELFTTFKNEVIYADLNSAEVQEIIFERYSLDERREIFNPVIDTLKESSDYEVSVTDQHFSKVVQTLKPVSRFTESVFKRIPEIGLSNEPIQLQRNFEIIKPTGGKKRFLSENLNSAEFSWLIQQQLESKKRIAIIRVPYEVKIIFESGIFSINDNDLKIFVTDNDYEHIKHIYADALIDAFVELQAKQEIGEILNDEKDRLDLMKYYVMKNW